MLVLSRSFQPTPQLMKLPGAGKLPPKMAQLQKQYQIDDGKPIFLKGGSMDNILYRLTLILAVVGTLGDVWLWLGYIIA
ncbi:hypothetical protein KR044_011785 [Drosophila immigrans]|nr:hypothetical protein KR044_011785 [Drosophila immigrans]